MMKLKKMSSDFSKNDDKKIQDTFNRWCRLALSDSETQHLPHQVNHLCNQIKMNVMKGRLQYKI